MFVRQVYNDLCLIFHTFKVTAFNQSRIIKWCTLGKIDLHVMNVGFMFEVLQNTACDPLGIF